MDSRQRFLANLIDWLHLVLLCILIVCAVRLIRSDWMSYTTRSSMNCVLSFRLLYMYTKWEAALLCETCSLSDYLWYIMSRNCVRSLSVNSGEVTVCSIQHCLHRSGSFAAGPDVAHAFSTEPTADCFRLSLEASR